MSSLSNACTAALRPSYVCACLLAGLDASEGRRRHRKRGTTPDAIGLSVKRRLLECAVTDDPEPGEFEQWLVTACWMPERIEGDCAELTPGTIQAMAMDVLGEWRMAEHLPEFRRWLEHGAPSEDAGQAP